MALILPWPPVCPPRNSAVRTCTGYGFHLGTDAFASCLQKESLAPALLGCSAAGSVLGLGYWWGAGWGP